MRELISVDDVMEDPEMHFGPNGGLVYCMEYSFAVIFFLLYCCSSLISLHHLCDVGRSTVSNFVECHLCRYVASHLEWLTERMEDTLEDDYILFDCPGQIELYTHLTVCRRVLFG